MVLEGASNHRSEWNLEVRLTGSGGRISSSGSWGAIMIVDWEEIGAFEAVVAVVS